MKFQNLSSGEEANKWVKQSIRECQATYFLPTLDKPDQKIPVAVDIGANVGGFCIHAHNTFDKIYAFEPLRENYFILEQTLKQLNINNVEIFNNAVYSEGDKELSLKAHKNKLSGDVTCIDIQNNDFIDLKQRCETISLDNIFNYLNIDRIDYLKIDCEGAEFDILENFSNFDKIAIMAIELHDYCGARRKVDLLQTLQERYHVHFYTPEDALRGETKKMIQSFLDSRDRKHTFNELKVVENCFCINKEFYKITMDEKKKKVYQRPWTTSIKAPHTLSIY